MTVNSLSELFTSDLLYYPYIFLYLIMIVIDNNFQVVCACFASVYHKPPVGQDNNLQRNFIVMRVDTKPVQGIGRYVGFFEQPLDGFVDNILSIIPGWDFLRIRPREFWNDFVNTGRGR